MYGLILAVLAWKGQQPDKHANTYWYLTAVPELMAVAAAKFERFVQTQEVKHAVVNLSARSLRHHFQH